MKASTGLHIDRGRIRIIILCLSILLANSLRTTGQDTLTVTGTVLDASGNPVDGVAVSVEGVQQAPAITDTTGQFRLSSPAGDVWLLVDPLEEHKGQRIFLNRRSTLNIFLTPVEMASGEDMVSGLFRPRLRKNMVSAYTSPAPGNAIYYPQQTIDQYFQVSVPGLWTTRQSGMPMSGVTTFLRGIRSTSTTSQPLYVVDGIPVEAPGLFQSLMSGYTYNPLSSLDPMDITSITVLKDYLGGALYGVRGANGVVLIETLKPGVLETTIDVAYRTGIGIQPDQIPQLNSDQYKTLANEVLMSSGFPEEDYMEEFFPLYMTEADEEYYKYDKNTNWQNEIFRNSLMNDVYVRVMGGDEIARYGLSVSYLNHQGIIRNTDGNRLGVRFAGSFNIFQWLRMHISSNLINNQSNFRESALSPKTSPILTALFKAPILNPFQYDENGQQLTSLEEVNSLGISNPVSVINRFEGHNSNYRFTTSFRMEGDLWQDRLQWTSLLGINLNSLSEGVFMPNTGMELYYNGEAWNAAKLLNNYLYSMYLDNYLSYHQTFNNIHLVSAAAGVRMNQNRFEIDWGLTKNAHERDEYKQLQNGVSYLREMGGESSNWNRLGTYAMVSYSFKDKYLLNANIVGEYSSRVGQNAVDMILIGGEPFGLFYSAGAGWRLSSESFMADLHWLQELKVRASYGLAGNDDIGNLASLQYYTVDHYRETTAMVPGILTDQTLKFETNKQLNVGMDLGLFAHRINFTADWYLNTTEDLVVYEPQPSYLGYSLVPSNNGSLSNNGWELALSGRILNMEKLTWEVGMHLSQFNNVVISIQDDAVVSPFEGGYFISQVGEPVLSFYGFRYRGVYATSAEAAEDGLVTEKGVPFGAGDVIYDDISGPEGSPDGVINELDRTIIGSPIPSLFGGGSSMIRYGRWSLSAHLQMVTGQEVYNYVRYQNERMTGLANQSTHTLSRWTHEGQETNVPRALYNDPVGNSAFSSRWIEDGSYIRLKHLTLAYRIPEQVWFFRNLEVFATATNLYTWTKYLGYDPEFSYSYHNMEQGIDYGLIPPVKSYIVGFSIGL